MEQPIRIRSLNLSVYLPHWFRRLALLNYERSSANMESIFLLDTLPFTASTSTPRQSLFLRSSLPSLNTHASSSSHFRSFGRSASLPGLRRMPVAAGHSVVVNSVPQPRSEVYTVGEFMTRKEDLHVVNPTTSVDEALEALVEHRITGFPVIDDDWKLVGVVSDYDLLALDSISGHPKTDNNDMFPEVDSTWKTFNEVQKLLSKTRGKLVGELMTPAPMVVRETTNLEDAARLLLETKFRRLPVVDADGKLVGLITRGNVVRAALQMKRDNEKKA